MTDREVTRYFMTIPEAAQLVIQAGAMARGGDVFVLDMGDPVRIVDLATTLIRLSGRSVRDAENPAGDIEIVEIGLRNGEKRYEELVAKSADLEVPRPAHWGGYRLVPDAIEFWQGRQSRLHDRLLYTRQADGSWSRSRLAP